MEPYDILHRDTGEHLGRSAYDRLSVEGTAKVHFWCVFYGALSGEIIYARTA